MGKESTCGPGDAGSIPGSGSSPGGGNDNPFQYSCLENPMDRGLWWAAANRVAKSWTQLKRLITQMPQQHEDEGNRFQILVESLPFQLCS